MTLLRRTNLFALFIALWATVVPATAGSERDPHSLNTTLAVRLAVGAPVPDAARRAMMTEANRIWKHEGVTITWHDADTRHDASDSSLRVLILQSELGSPASGRGYAVADLHPDQKRIFASLPAAERTVRAGLRGVSRSFRPVPRPAQALGLVLGRALAHEFGHYLLGTGNHAEGGLMRATFSPRELVEMGGASFALDDDEETLLAQRLDGGLLSRTVATH